MKFAEGLTGYGVIILLYQYIIDCYLDLPGLLHLKILSLFSVYIGERVNVVASWLFVKA